MNSFATMGYWKYVGKCPTAGKCLCLNCLFAKSDQIKNKGSIQTHTNAKNFAKITKASRPKKQIIGKIPKFMVLEAVIQHFSTDKVKLHTEKRTYCSPVPNVTLISAACIQTWTSWLISTIILNQQWVSEWQGSTMEGTTRIWHATIPSPTHTWLAHRNNCSGSNSSGNVRRVLHNIRSPSRLYTCSCALLLCNRLAHATLFWLFWSRCWQLSSHRYQLRWWRSPF